MFISYSTQAMEALDGLAVFDRAAYVIAMLRVQGRLTSVEGDAMVSATVGISVDDNTFTVAFTASVIGVEATVHELDWQVSGL